MNINDVYDNAIFACFIQPGDRVKELGLVISVFPIDNGNVLLYVADIEFAIYDYPFDTLFELDLQI